MKRILTIISIALISISAFAGDSTNEVIKKGISLGPLPIVAFDQDKGFEYGAILNIYNFGNGDFYPNPKSQWHLEFGRYTKGSMLAVVSYDNKTLIPGVRINTALNFHYDTNLDFYGFNGADIDLDLLNNNVNYYRVSRKVPVFKFDLTGHITEHLYWKAGYHFGYFDMGNSTSEISLYNIYRASGLISSEDADGGITSALRAGLMYDSRNVEADPTRGIYADAHIIAAPNWLGTENDYAKFNITFRNYIPLGTDRLVFAYRLNYQGFLGDNVPFYVLPYDTYLGYGYDRDGFGGYRTARGILRNRVQGLQTGYFNSEIRWKFVNFVVLKQNVALAASGFFDGAKTFKNFPGPQFVDYKDKFHLATGAGFRIIINKNFIIAVEYGKALNNQDNQKGALYINTDWLF